MKKTVITSYARTPIGAFLGDLKSVPVEELATIAVKEAIKRSNLKNDEVEEVVLGHVISSADVANLGRFVALNAGLGTKTTGFTVNRICGSGIQAVISAAQEIQSGIYDVVVAGGAESLSRVPYYLPLSARYQGFRNGNQKLICSNEEHARTTAPRDLYPIETMGDTAENIVERYGISREDQDRFAFESQRKAKNAIESGRFAQEIVPVEIKTRKGTIIVDRDGHPRFDTTLEALSKLKPVFKEGGTVTAGNSSGMNDGAAALVLMSEDKCLELGLEPLAYIDTYAFDGVDPRVMGLGPVGAIQKILNKKGFTLEDIDILEINEAFAGQVLGCCKELGNYLDTPLYQRLNPNGGAVALGHPLGMSGARIIGSAALELNNKNMKYAIASACIGGGQGIAVLLEKK